MKLFKQPSGCSKSVIQQKSCIGSGCLVVLGVARFLTRLIFTFQHHSANVFFIDTCRSGGARRKHKLLSCVKLTWRTV